jgi:lactoylglutathione lyase
MSQQTRTRITQVGTVGIPVGDQDRALAFYRDILGFEIRMDVRAPDIGRWLEVAPPGSPTSVALVPAREDYPAGIDTGIRFSTEDAAADHAALITAGANVASELIPEPVPMFVLSDPDGNRLIVVQRPGG